MKITSQTRHGKVSWTLRRNPVTGQSEWVRPGTHEVDSRSPPPHDWTSVNVVTGVRPGRFSHKPSEDLLRSLERANQEQKREIEALRRERLCEIDRDFASGKRRMDPELRLGHPVVGLPLEDGIVHYVQADKVSKGTLRRIEAERDVALAKLEIARQRERAAAAQPLAERDPERKKADLAALARQIQDAKAAAEARGPTEAVFEGAGHPNTVAPTEPVHHISEAQFLDWKPMRNDEKRML